MTISTSLPKAFPNLIFIHRLTITYALVIGFVATIARWFGSGPFWNLYQEQCDLCVNNWWRNLLYINNFFPSQECCLGVTWYLSNDMQVRKCTFLFYHLQHESTPVFMRTDHDFFAVLPVCTPYLPPYLVLRKARTPLVVHQPHCFHCCPSLHIILQSYATHRVSIIMLLFLPYYSYEKFVRNNVACDSPWHLLFLPL